MKAKYKVGDYVEFIYSYIPGTYQNCELRVDIIVDVRLTPNLVQYVYTFAKPTLIRERFEKYIVRKLTEEQALIWLLEN